MQIRAAVLTNMGLPAPYAQSKPLKITKVRLDPPGKGEVLVKIKVAGLCHSDLSVISGNRKRFMPMVLGHEASGEVVEVGADVKSLKVGDHVVTQFVPTCGHCAYCTEGRPALCEPGAEANTRGVLLSGQRRLHIDDQDLNHHLGISCFADYAVMSEKSCNKISREISHREAAIFGCAVLTGVGAVVNRARIKIGQSAVVVGLGGVGLSTLIALVASGACKIVAVDLNDNKLALAKSLGATHTINPKHIRSDKDLLEAADGPVDFGFDMAGSVAAFETMYKLTRRGGTSITSGLPSAESTFNLPLSQVVGEERAILGSYLGSGSPSVDINRYIDLYLSGRLPINKLLGQTFMLEQINLGFDHLASGSSLRDCIMMDAV